MDWYAVGLSQDLREAMAMPGHVEGTDRAGWRSASGKVHAWGDRCPHRGMRLSHGFVRGETLSCIYHGWQYGQDGGCTSIPAHPKLTPPKTICATTYRCVEADGLIWVALKDVSTNPPALAGATPVRSVQINAPIDQVAQHFGDVNASVVTLGATTLVLHPTDDAHCTAHVLTNADPKEASQWIEAQRAEIEGMAA